MIRAIACCVAVSVMTTGNLSAELYNPAVPGVSSGGACGCNSGGCNAGGPRAVFGNCQACPGGSGASNFYQNCPVPGGINVGGMCPTCPSSYGGHMGNCPHSHMGNCPHSGMCPQSGSSCKSCSLGWCMPTGLCCLDNPCQMPPHFAYKPANHGHYYFAPYNYTTVLKQKAYAQMQNLDPTMPYVATTFDSSYAAVIGDREKDKFEEAVVRPTKGLPDLEAILGHK